MMKRTIISHIFLMLCFMSFVACSSQDDIISQSDNDNIIHVGNVSTDNMVTTATVTRTAVAAETLPWLKEALKKGMDITYLLDENTQKAKLELQVDNDDKVQTSEGGFTIYNLKAYDANNNLTDIPAKWLGFF